MVHKIIFGLIFSVLILMALVCISLNKHYEPIVLKPENGWECAKLINGKCTFYRHK